eukprot:1107751-Prorocentrum_minimum.AAC.1
MLRAHQGRSVRSHGYPCAVYCHDGPIRRRKLGNILTTDQSDAGSAGIFSRRTNETIKAKDSSSGLLLPDFLGGEPVREPFQRKGQICL